MNQPSEAIAVVRRSIEEVELLAFDMPRPGVRS
jgi:hypothetical protein